ncbi:Piso0_003082 [Millerozyma farinosa CBS 7064]|uniref:Piso0_003082 protein n=1 Tax=Pichia sorbitophila (strain ATCC MYA-4447 / BCRC 22081 / CBS 7064 / NBRC 10061 / NRRL Y-12695) TaxID=559304 RepID=G8YH52_PICSO|nr:Piso0_003082 [Millerozyma farinosa CBS 7064]CCE80754.1 Piso0_003082 [Millerozyma farinosa CBS 7064]
MCLGRRLAKMSNNFIQDLNLKLPVIQAPMAGVTKSAMVIASCRSGIVGSLGAGMLKPEDIRESIKEIKSEAEGAPFNINLFVIDHYGNGYDWDDREVAWLQQYYQEQSLGELPRPKSFAPVFKEQFQAVLEEAPPIVSFTFGIVEASDVQECHRRSIKVIGTATNVLEALEWEKVGADAICVQGIEAGGHRGNFLDLDDPGTGLFALIPEVTSKVNIPVIAAGGVMDGRGIAAAKILGASAVQMGTAFLASHEAALPEAYKKGITGGVFSHETTLTNAFSGRYARGVKNSFTEFGKGKHVLPYPVQNALTQPLRKASTQKGDPDHISLWAGQGVNKVRQKKISEICNELRLELDKVKSNGLSKL